jgi:hypothetical protein
MAAGHVIGEEIAPALADGLRIPPELVVHVVDQPGIRAECAARNRLADT